jgi:Fe-S-cluster containining protein
LIFCLTVHARYACAHSGACCTAGWEIPVEPEVRRLIELRGIRPRSDAGDRLFVTPERTLGNLDVVAGTRPNGECVFFEARDGRLCAIHRQGGPALLPSACRHFPRIVLRDARGTFVTLSHFCPTAAGLLQQPADLAVIEAPSSLSLGGDLEGLDATAVMPPLLRPGLLRDLAGYTKWERAGIAILNRPELSAGNALDIIAAATREICDWQPRMGSLSDHVTRIFGRHVGRLAAGLKPLPDDRPTRAFVAAHLFANWIAYQGSGLEDVVQYLRDALALLTCAVAEHGSFVDAARATDLRLRHQSTSVTASARSRLPQERRVVI